jgi:tRNA (guanine37-N1)-methyltransferase
MRIDILTLFPDMVQAVLANAIFQRASEKELVDMRVHNIRDYTHDKHHVVDDYPFGGGAGMLLKPEPLFEAVEGVLADLAPEEGRPAVVLMTPQGKPLKQASAGELSAYSRLLVICGHYEGVDERVREHLVTHEISIGDYVLSGGELPALVLCDTIVRLIPGVLGSDESALTDSHSNGLLEYPQYTRPPEFRGWKVPEILLSGHHARIEKWRREQSLRRTLARRPDLLADASLTPADKKLLAKIEEEGAGSDAP